MVLVHFLYELYTYLSLSPPRSKRRFIILVFPYHHTINIKNRIPEFVVYTSASVLIMKNVDVTSTSPFEICFKDSNITHFAIFFKVLWYIPNSSRQYLMYEISSYLFLCPYSSLLNFTLSIAYQIFTVNKYMQEWI